MSIKVLTLILVITFISVEGEGIRIGAFNIQTFGTSKYGKENVMRYIDRVSL